MANLLLFLSDFSDLSTIGEKIIPKDPWAFVVQLTATFILVFVLQKFLVKPVRKYMEERQAYIQGNIDEANTKNAEAEAKLADANAQIKDAKTTSKELVENAKVTALNQKDKILEETKKEVDDMRRKAHEDIANERKQMKEDFQKEAIDIVMMAASKVVEREVNSEDNKKLVDSFIKDEVDNG